MVLQINQSILTRLFFLTSKIAVFQNITSTQPSLYIWCDFYIRSMHKLLNTNLMFPLNVY